MENKTTLNMTKEYFDECFHESIRYGNKWRRVEYVIAAVFFLAGIGLLIYTKAQYLTPLVLVAIGVFEFFSPYLKKIWWVKRQMSSKVANKAIELTINEQGIATKSPYSESTMSWEGIERILETPKGVLIWPQKGMHIYLPKSIVKPEAVKYILSKAV